MKYIRCEKIGFVKPLSLLFVLFFFQIAYSQELHSYIESQTVGDYGYKDSYGNVIIKPRFKKVREFSDGLAAVSNDYGQHWGYIDKTGKIVIKLQFSSVGDFSEGLAKVLVKGGWGYIDKTGKIVIDGKFSEAGDFSGGLARVKMVVQKSVGGLVYGWVYINKKGVVVIPSRYYKVDDFSEGLAAVNFGDGRYGYIDKTGKEIVVMQAEKAHPFSEGLAAVKIRDASGFYRYGYINKNGRIVIKQQFLDAWDFKDGCAKVEYQDENVSGSGGWGYIDKTGKSIGPRVFRDSEEFSGKVAKVHVRNQKTYEYEWKYMTNTGEIYNNYSVALIAAENFSSYMKRMLPAWDDYLAIRGVTKPETPTTESVKKIVERQINSWQKRGEFESTSEWEIRVNEQTRASKVKEIEAQLKAEYKNKVLAYNQGLEAAKTSYEREYRIKAHGYCSGRAVVFATQKFTLKPYDADNETFLISTASNGDILLPVPRSDAQQFKANWEDIKKNVKAVFVPNGNNDVSLKSVTFGNYTYDGNTNANYAIASTNYNFAPIEISDVNWTSVDYHFNQIASPNLTVSNSRSNTVSSTPSDVDINIPSAKTVAHNTFAIVIANENYKTVASVDNAANDGNIVAKYLTTTLGIPQNQVFSYTNASYGEMIDALDRLKNVADAYKGSDFNVIFYYAGHGVPDEQSYEAYLLPIDGKPGVSAVNVPLSKLYSTLGNLGASSVFVMLDACFSGARRGEGMLAQARGVAIKAKAAEPRGNMVVLSAAQGDETAYPYKGKNHGLFTYFMLKKLQSSMGNVTIGELSDYVIDNVKKVSVVENKGKIQTPTVRASQSAVTNWKSIKLVR